MEHNAEFVKERMTIERVGEHLRKLRQKVRCDKNTLKWKGCEQMKKETTMQLSDLFLNYVYSALCPRQKHTDNIVHLTPPA